MYYLKLYELWQFFFRHPVKSIRCVAFETADWKDDKKLFFFFIDIRIYAFLVAKYKA